MTVSGAINKVERSVEELKNALISKLEGKPVIDIDGLYVDYLDSNSGMLIEMEVQEVKSVLGELLVIGENYPYRESVEVSIESCGMDGLLEVAKYIITA